MKTNKAYRKRIKVTKKGKLITRAKGQNHYNAKESGRKQFAKARAVSIKLSNKVKRRFLSGIK